MAVFDANQLMTSGLVSISGIPLGGINYCASTLTPPLPSTTPLFSYLDRRRQPHVAPKLDEHILPLLNFWCRRRFEGEQPFIDARDRRVLPDSAQAGRAAREVVAGFRVFRLFLFEEAVAGDDVDRLFQQGQIAQPDLVVVVVFPGFAAVKMPEFASGVSGRMCSISSAV